MKKKKLYGIVTVITCFIACGMLAIPAFADEEFTEADRQLFGIFPVWLFILILAAVVMAAIIILVEIFKRKNK